MSKLLEQAIADAKAVRATALANAKAALEEAFMPRAEAMLSQKLKEEAGLDSIPTNPTDPSAHPALENTDAIQNEETVTNEELEEILAELSGDLDGEEGVPPVDAAPVVPVGDPATVVAPAAPVGDVAAPVAPATDVVAPAAPVGDVAAPVAPATDVVAPVAPAAPTDQAVPPVTDDDIDLNELLASLNETADDKEEKADKKADEKEEEEDEKEVTKESYDALVAERNDAVAAVDHYRKQLNEVNLLNAKLLYTNKLFKNYGLTNEQKMKIVETFDLTQTVREVKIAYTSLAESFNFGKSTVKKTNTVVKTITEGLASKPVASTKPAPSVIVENTNAQAIRFQTLAGIKVAKI
jgi:hypothetical protein